MKQKIALISVFAKDGIDTFSKALVDMGWTILSSGGTATFLKEKGIPVTDTADVTGLKAMLSHRVATLHPKIHGGLLALDTPEHLREMEENDIPWIDLVCCDFYPLEAEIAKSDSTAESVIEKTDIGGPTMIRSGAKGRRIVICDVSDRTPVIEWLKAGEPDRDTFTTALAAKAEFVIGQYCTTSGNYHSSGKYVGIFGEQALECLYGENAWQKPAYLYTNPRNQNPLAISKWQLVDGTPMSYNNMVDVDRMIQTVTHIGAGFEKNFGTVPFVAVGVKHGNACGASAKSDPVAAIEAMLEGDLRAIFGGLIMCNFPIGEQEAKALINYKMGDGQKRLLDSVAAPSFTEAAIELLARKNGKCRLVANPSIDHAGLSSIDTTPRFRMLTGGDFLMQPNYTFVLDCKDSNFVEAHAPVTPNEQILKDVVFAWAVGSTSNSNTITLVKDGKLLGNGVGQQDRVSAAGLAVSRARDSHSFLGDTTPFSLADTVAYGDSFFPFPDAPARLIKEGIRVIFSTSGSVNDPKTIDLCKEKGVALYMIPDKIGRGFYNH